MENEQLNKTTRERDPTEQNSNENADESIIPETDPSSNQVPEGTTPGSDTSGNTNDSIVSADEGPVVSSVESSCDSPETEIEQQAHEINDDIFTMGQIQQSSDSAASEMLSDDVSTLSESSATLEDFLESYLFRDDSVVIDIPDDFDSVQETLINFDFERFLPQESRDPKVNAKAEVAKKENKATKIAHVKEVDCNKIPAAITGENLASCSRDVVKNSPDFKYDTPQGVNHLKMRPSVTRKKKLRCQQCHKKVGLTAIQCRCGGLFCSLHRYVNEHGCTFDYKAMGAEEIKKNNPLIIAEKVAKI